MGRNGVELGPDADGLAALDHIRVPSSLSKDSISPIQPFPIHYFRRRLGRVQWRSRGADNSFEGNGSLVKYQDVLG